MNARKYYKRARGILRPEVLRSKRVAVVGCGSGGSRVATELGRLGVNQLLIDLPGEHLEEHNILRHELGYRSLGRPKTTELAAHIHNLNPETEIISAECDVLERQDAFEALLDRNPVDLVLACTDNPSSRFALNAVCVRRAIPMVGGAVYDGGVGGEISRTGPGEACLACLSVVTGNGPRSSRRRRINYDNPNRRELRSTNALNLDISQICLLHARVALQVLLGQEAKITGLPAEVNVIRFANRCYGGVLARPLHAEFFAVPRCQECLICGAKGAAVVAEADAILARLGS